jgi:phosphomannomutase
MSHGIDVYNLGVAPTPTAFMEARKYGAGMIITASHNPLEWNGLKFVIDGRGLFEEELEAMLNASQVYQGKFGSEHDIVSGYVEEIAKITTKNNAAKLRVGIDPGGGAGCGYAERLFGNLGHQYYTVNGNAGVSSRGPDPTADPLQDLKALVISNHLEYGFALDLDADRLVVVNRSGEKLNPDATLLLCVSRAVGMGMKNFVVSTDTSITIERYVKERHGRVAYSKVGEANVVRKMLEAGADAGGEGSSGGFIMPRFNMCRDGLLAAATISALDKETFDGCLEFASHYKQVRSKIVADLSTHKAVIDRLADVLKEESSSINIDDGVKAIVDEDSWILVRPSNTEDAIRISVESTAGRALSLHKKASEKVQAIYEKVR